MSDDERLREALLELQLLRERETLALAETRALLDCIERVSSAPTAEAALQSIFTSLNAKLHADLSLLAVSDGDGSDGYRIAAADPDWVVNRRLIPPIDLSRRNRNITDLSMLGDWGGDLPLEEFKGLLVAPSRGPDATTRLLICLRRKPDAFRKGDIKLVSRLSGLAVQSLQNATVSAEHRLLAAAIEGSAAGFAIANAGGEDRPLIYVNAAFEELTGYSKDEVIGRNCRLLSAEAPDAPERERLRKTISENGRGRFLLRNRRKSGELFWNELTVFPVEDSDGQAQYLVATQSDVSDRISAEEERNRFRDRLEQSLAVTDDGFILLEPDGTVAYANAAIARFFPAPRSGWATGRPFETCWAEYIHDNASAPETAALAQLTPVGLARTRAGREMDLPSGNTLLLHGRTLSDGTIVITATNVTAMKAAQSLLEQRLAAIEAAQDGIAIVDDGDRLTYVNAAAAHLLGFPHKARALGRNWTQLYDTPVGDRDGGEFQLSLSRRQDSAEVIHEITGSPLSQRGSVLTIRDATERLATEAREAELRSALTRSQRQEALAQLSAGLAHDFNNLLSAINGSAALISSDGETAEAVRNHADRITNAGRRAARLVNRLLDIGAPPTGQTSFELNLALAELPELVGSSLPGKVSLHLDRVAQPLTVRGEPGDLSRIVVNLVLNAGDAIPNGRGRITVRSGAITPDAYVALDAGTLRAGHRYARIDVTDTGCGMDAETRARALEPFFTTKGATGTGLGLAMVAQHSTAIGGGVQLRTAPGKGTTVSVYWPLADQLLDSDDENRGDTAQDLGGLTLLVVDDEPDVAEVLQRNLEAFGAEVACCTDPRDALEAITTDPTAWSALLTDYDMPGMTGGDLTACVTVAAPDLPIFIITALPRRLSDPRLGREQIAEVFSKPVDLARLREALSNLCRTS